MDRKPLIFAIIFACITLIASPAFSQGEYFGFGLAYTKLTTDDTSLFDRSSGPGFILSGGFPLNDQLALDFFLSTSVMEDRDNDDFTYGVIGGGLRVDLQSLYEKGWTPWAAGYLSYHSIEWEWFLDQVDGFGFTTAAGLDFRVTLDGVVQTGIRFHNFEADHEVPSLGSVARYDTTTSEIFVNYLVRTW